MRRNVNKLKELKVSQVTITKEEKNPNPTNVKSVTDNLCNIEGRFFSGNSKE